MSASGPSGPLVQNEGIEFGKKNPNIRLNKVF